MVNSFLALLLVRSGRKMVYSCGSCQKVIQTALIADAFIILSANKSNTIDDYGSATEYKQLEGSVSMQ